VNVADRLVRYGSEEVLHIDDGIVVSAFDYPGAEYMRRFRSFMWKTADVQPSGPSSETVDDIFMKRPIHAKRPMFCQKRIHSIAQEEGFRCVNPANLSVAEQVRLFANAASVAGLTGATFTNLAFCRPGTRVLELTRRETAWPDFIGISLALELKHRLCLGRIDPSALGTPNIYDAPPRFDEVTVRRELQRLRTSHR
jgi:capsular polysaccharide biosynthesis protein